MIAWPVFFAFARRRVVRNTVTAHLLLVLWALASCAVASAQAVQPPVSGPACEGPDVDPWVTGLRDRALSSNQLAAYALERYGPLLHCTGLVTTEFDGAKFGIVRLEFTGGVILTIETMPPETSIVSLRAGAGFGDAGALRRVLEAYAAGAGLHIDWTAPTVTREGDERRATFWDPDPGLNASATLLFVQDTLVAVGVSMAL